MFLSYSDSAVYVYVCSGSREQSRTSSWLCINIDAMQSEVREATSADGSSGTGLTCKGLEDQRPCLYMWHKYNLTFTSSRNNINTKKTN